MKAFITALVIISRLALAGRFGLKKGRIVQGD
jgi:hypothetical protein